MARRLHRAGKAIAQKFQSGLTVARGILGRAALVRDILIGEGEERDLVR
jgi:hypothetical protein